MPFSISKFSKLLQSAFSLLEKSQADALSIEIAANYTAGRTAGNKHTSYLPKSTDSVVSQEEDDELTTEEKAEIATLTAISLGYLSGFNKLTQAQILSKAKEIIQVGGSERDIKQYVDDVFDGKESITIDNVGKKRKELYVDKNLKLSEVETTISKPFYASVLAYAIMSGESAAHSAYEAGRKATLLRQGYGKWVFVGPADERARAWHVAILGQVFTWGTDQSNYAEQCLQEPRCRHRSQVYYGDSRDTPAEEWQKLKDDAGLFWNKEKKTWDLK